MYANVREEVKRQGAQADNIDVLTTTATAMAFEPENDVDMIICLTETGKIARQLAKHRPRQPILACSIYGHTIRQMNANRGVVGYKIPQYENGRGDDVLQLVLKIAQKQGLCNLPYSQVMIFIGENEEKGEENGEQYTFKVLGGEEMPEEYQAKQADEE